MKMNDIDLDEIQLYLQLAKEMKPVVKEALDTVLDEYAPLLGDIAERFRNHVVVSTDKTIKQFEELGYSRDEAMLLTLNSKLAVEESMRNLGKNKK